MNLLTIVEVAIGICFIWFLASMMVSAIQEFVASLLHWRARDLENAIRQMLEDPARESGWEQSFAIFRSLPGRFGKVLHSRAPTPNLLSQPAGAAVGLDAPVPALQHEATVISGPLSGSNVASPLPTKAAVPRLSKGFSFGEEFYQHPLIRRLSLQPEKYGPSYIPTAHFADVVFDLIVEAGSAESPVLHAAQQANDLLQRLSGPENHAPDPKFKIIYGQFINAVEAISGWAHPADRNQGAISRFHELTNRFVERNPTFGPAIQALQATLEEPPLRRQLGAGVLAIAGRNPALGRTLNTLVMRALENAKDADGAVATARKNVETWFDSTMERLKGNYKRNVQSFALLIGCLVALLFNIDSWAIVRTLWFEPTIRDALVSSAQSTAASGQQAAANKDVQQIVADLQSIQIPIGWSYISATSPSATGTTTQNLCEAYFGPVGRSWDHCFYPVGYPTQNALYRPTVWGSLVGILITGLASMPGATFWFDLISKLVNLRASGLVPAPLTATTDKKQNS